MLRFPGFRLLPATILGMMCLLALKSTDLVRAAVISRESAPKMVTVAEAATPPAQLAVPSPVTDTAAAPISDAEKALLLDLRQRRVELDAREAALVARESVLAAAEQKISARVNELQALQARLEAVEAARKERESAGWQGLVKLYEAMKPRDAATIFNDLDMPVLLQVVDRMKEAKAAPVVAAMQPDKARDLTAKLAQMRTQRDAAPGS